MKIFIKLLCLTFAACLTSATANAAAAIAEKQNTPAIPVHTAAVKAHPASRQYMRPPQHGDFAVTKNTIGKYTLAVPYSFGGDPLAGLQNAQGAMLLRAFSDNLAMAVNVIDPTDSAHYNAVRGLPEFSGKKVICKWEHDSALIWQCTLSRQQDYFGDKIIFEAKAARQPQIYELLYVFPTESFAFYLPQTLYSLNSFRIDKQK